MGGYRKKVNIPLGDRHKPFPSRLRALMDNTDNCSPLGRKISQSELAKSVDMQRQAIYSYAWGGSSPQIEKFRELAKFFSVSYDYLFGESESALPENQTISQDIGLGDPALNVLKSLASKGLKLNEVALNGELEKLPSEEIEEMRAAIRKLRVINKMMTDSKFLVFIKALEEYAFLDIWMHNIQLIDNSKESQLSDTEKNSMIEAIYEQKIIDAIKAIAENIRSYANDYMDTPIKELFPEKGDGKDGDDHQETE